MKINLKAAILFILLGVALFMISVLNHSNLAEKWSSFAMGLSFPLFVAGVIAIITHIRRSRQQQ